MLPEGAHVEKSRYDRGSAGMIKLKVLPVKPVQGQGQMEIKKKFCTER